MERIANWIEATLEHKHQVAYYSALLVSTAGVAVTIKEVHGSWWIGVMGAVAVDFGMLTFSDILARSKNSVKRWMIWIAVSFMTFLSISANLYSALSNRIDRSAISVILRSDEFIVVMSVLFGAMFPIIVLALSGYRPAKKVEKVKKEALTDEELEALGIPSARDRDKKKKEDANQLTFQV